MMAIMQIFLFLYLCLMTSISCKEEMTYRERVTKFIHPQRIKNFYKRAVELFSNNKSFASVSHYGVGVFANKNFKTNEVIMEVTSNFTISSYDDIFPFMDVFDKYANATYQGGHLVERNMFRLLLNLNYLRYVNNTNRFFRIFFNNLPDTYEYVPYWGDEKQILTKFNMDIRPESDMFVFNSTFIDGLISFMEKELRKKDPNLVDTMFSYDRIKSGINLIYTRSFYITYKGWKVIHSMTDNVDQEDLKNIGYIIMPGVDAFNHESFISEHPDLKLSTIINTKGKVQIRASRPFKKGEEIFINYDHFATISEIFKRYGFVDITSLISNHIYDRTILSISQSRPELRQLCLALGSCYAPDVVGKGDLLVPTWSNSIDFSNLNIERLKNWLGKEISEYTYIDVYNEIKSNTHSNYTEAVALSEFLHSFYSKILFASQFKTSVRDLLEMYDLNEIGTEINDIFKKKEIKFQLKNITPDIYFKFREIIKLSLLHQHMTAINFRASKPMLNQTLDHLLNEMNKEIMDDYKY